MSTITAPTYDPTSTATALAQKATAIRQQQITDQTNAANADTKALASLKSAISAFQASLGSLTGIGKSMLAQSATLSNTNVGSATAQPSAPGGSYSLFVKQVASASQVSYNIGANAPVGGTLTVNLAPPAATTPPSPPSPVSPAPASFTVKLNAAADTDGDGKLSAREIATAINSEPTNAGKVSAGVVTVAGVAQLVLTSKNTGVANTVWLDPTAVGDSTLAGSLALDKRKVTTQAQDAIILFGGTSSTTGTEITQASNTFTNIDGVSLSVTRAQAADESPFTLSVGSNSSGTQANVQAFVDAYNKLKSAIDGLVDSGNPSSGAKPGAFAHDAGVRALQSRLLSMVRSNGTPSLASYGITGTRDGTLALDTTKLTKQLTTDPTGLDRLIGSTAVSKPGGIAGALNTYLNQWGDDNAGQIKQRTDATTKLQTSLTKRQSDLDAQYDAAYQRYLKQFTQLQTLQSTMNSNVSMFDALFSSDKSN
jgi:flagellar hook-associated protein 2